MTASRRFRTAIGAVAVLGLVCVTGACSDSGDKKPPPKPSSSAPPPPPTDALAQTWSTRLPDGTVTAPEIGVAPGVVMIDHPDEGVLAYASDSGKEAWRLQLPGDAGPCAVPGPVNSAGLAPVEFAPAGTRECTGAGVVDTRTGALLWHRDFVAEMAFRTSVHTSLGPAVLTVEMPCGELRRFDAATGRELPTLLPRDRACAHSVAHNGRYVAALYAPDDGTPEVAPGWVPPLAGRSGELVLHDSETGARLWSRPVADRAGWKVFRIVSSDPLALDLETDSGRYIRVYDRQGNEVRTVGPPLPHTSRDWPLERAFEGVWVQRPDGFTQGLGAGLPAFDLHRGTQLPGVPAGVAANGDQTVGSSRGRIVTVVRKLPAPDSSGGVELRVVGYDVRTGDRKDLGRLDQTGLLMQGKFTSLHVVSAHDGRLFVIRTADRASDLVLLSLPD